MSTTHPSGPGGLAYALGGMAVASGVFYYLQNGAGQVGGPISVEKSLWLNYALTAWFVVPTFLVRHPDLHRGVRRLVSVFLASMVARGAAELWLIYVAFGWSPLYGIAHDTATLVGIAALRRARRREIAAHAGSFDRATLGYLTGVQFSLVAEIAFASLFYRMHVHERAVYFAPPTEAFAHITLLTRWVDVAVYTHLARYLWRERHHLLRRGSFIRSPA